MLKIMELPDHNTAIFMVRDDSYKALLRHWATANHYQRYVVKIFILLKKNKKNIILTHTCVVLPFWYLVTAQPRGGLLDFSWARQCCETSLWCSVWWISPSICGQLSFPTHRKFFPSLLLMERLSHNLHIGNAILSKVMHCTCSVHDRIWTMSTERPPTSSGAAVGQFSFRNDTLKKKRKNLTFKSWKLNSYETLPMAAFSVTFVCFLGREVYSKGLFT